jgi:hypothetical protein
MGLATHAEGMYNLSDKDIALYREYTVIPFNYPEYSGEKIVYLLK